MGCPGREGCRVGMQGALARTEIGYPGVWDAAGMDGGTQGSGMRMPKCGLPGRNRGAEERSEGCGVTRGWDAELPGAGRGGQTRLPGPGGAGGGSTWLISRKRLNIYEVLLFESQVFGSSYKELRHPPITW